MPAPPAIRLFTAIFWIRLVIGLAATLGNWPIFRPRLADLLGGGTQALSAFTATAVAGTILQLALWFGIAQRRYRPAAVTLVGLLATRVFLIVVGVAAVPHGVAMATFALDLAMFACLVSRDGRQWFDQPAKISSTTAAD